MPELNIFDLIWLTWTIWSNCCRTSRHLYRRKVQYHIAVATSMPIGFIFQTKLTVGAWFPSCLYGWIGIVLDCSSARYWFIEFLIFILHFELIYTLLVGWLGTCSLVHIELAVNRILDLAAKSAAAMWLVGVILSLQCDWSVCGGRGRRWWKRRESFVTRWVLRWWFQVIRSMLAMTVRCSVSSHFTAARLRTVTLSELRHSTVIKIMWWHMLYGQCELIGANQK